MNKEHYMSIISKKYKSIIAITSEAKVKASLDWFY